MNFKLLTEEESFREDVRVFLRRELPKGWIGMAGDAHDDGDWEFNLQIRRKMGEKGWLSMAWPHQYGGTEASHLKQLVFAEEIAYHRSPGRDIIGLRMIAPTMILYGTEEQKRLHLPPMAAGEVQWCQGYSEPGTGSDLASVETSAVEDGDDFIINGSKIWTSYGHRADWMFLLARTDPNARKHRGISVFLADMNTPGITIRPITNMADLVHFNQIFFDSVRVPKENMLGEENMGWYIGATLLDFERSAIEFPAEARRTLDDLVGFCQLTKVNGKYINEDPVLRNRLADLFVQEEVCRLMNYWIAWMQGKGVVPNKEASIVKVMGTELLQRVAGLGMEILGLYGQLEPDSKYAKLHGIIEKMYMAVIARTIAGGTSEIQRNIIATRSLGLPRG